MDGGSRDARVIIPFFSPWLATCGARWRAIIEKRFATAAEYSAIPAIADTYARFSFRPIVADRPSNRRWPGRKRSCTVARKPF